MFSCQLQTAIRKTPKKKEEKYENLGNSIEIFNTKTSQTPFNLTIKIIANTAANDKIKRYPKRNIIIDEYQFKKKQKKNRIE